MLLSMSLLNCLLSRSIAANMMTETLAACSQEWTEPDPDSLCRPFSWDPSVTTPEFQGYCYKIFDSPETWENANQKCSSLVSGEDYTLASIHNKEEADFVLNLADAGVTFGFYLGGVWRRNEGFLRYCDPALF